MAVDSYARDLASAALEKANSQGGGNTDVIQTSLPSGTLSSNVSYYLNTEEIITCKLPQGRLGDYIFIKFKSGENPTIIEITSNNFVGDMPVPLSNKTYEMICTWNGEVWVFSYRGY